MHLRGCISLQLLQDLVAQVYVTGRSSTALLASRPGGGNSTRGGHPAVRARRTHMSRCSMRQSLLLPLVAIVDSNGRTRGPYVAGVLEVARSKAAAAMSEALLKLILRTLGVRKALATQHGSIVLKFE